MILYWVLDLLHEYSIVNPQLKGLLVEKKREVKTLYSIFVRKLFEVVYTILISL